MMRITRIPAKLITREVFGPPRLDGQRVDDMEISEIYRVNSSNFFNVINKICGFWVFHHGFPSEFWSPFHAIPVFGSSLLHHARALDDLRQEHLTSTEEISDDAHSSPRWTAVVVVVDGFVSCFQRVPENIRVNLESSSQGG